MLRKMLRRGLDAADRATGGVLRDNLRPFLPVAPASGPVLVRLGGVSGEVPAGITLLQAGALLRVDIEHCCGGEATCGTCRVQVVEGMRRLSRVAPKEAGTLEAFAQGPNDRLACQARVLGPVVVEIPDDWRTL